MIFIASDTTSVPVKSKSIPIVAFPLIDATVRVCTDEFCKSTTGEFANVTAFRSDVAAAVPSCNVPPSTVVPPPRVNALFRITVPA